MSEFDLHVAGDAITSRWHYFLTCINNNRTAEYTLPRARKALIEQTIS